MLFVERTRRVYQRQRHFTAVVTNSVLILSQSPKLPLQFTIYPSDKVTPKTPVVTKQSPDTCIPVRFVSQVHESLPSASRTNNQFSL